MLSPHDIDLAARDRELPGLKLLLDADAFARAWWCNRQLPGKPEATIRYVRYKPGRRCIVMYAVRQSGSECQVVATAHHRDSWIKHCVTFDGGTCDTTPNDQDELSTAWVSVGQFPVDRKLRWLDDLRTNAGASRLVRGLIDGEWDDRFLQIKCVAYKPARRAVYDVQTSSSDRYAFKYFCADSFARSIDRTLSWDRCRQELMERGVELPETVQTDSKRRILVSRWLSGENLADQFSRSAIDLNLLYRVGGALGELHNSNPIGLAQIGRQEGKSCSQLAGDIGTLVPRLCVSARELAMTIQERLANRSVSSSPIHGDFYAKQICVDDDSVGILDFDQSVIGDPLEDVGNFIAKLIWNAHRGDFDSGQVSGMEEAFLCGYESRRGPQAKVDVDLHVAVGLFKCGTHPFRAGLHDWPSLTAAILDRVAKRLAISIEENVDPSSLKQQILRDVSEPWIANALIPERARERLMSCCPQLAEHGSRLEVERVEPLFYKPHRRCLIRYDLRITQSQTPDQFRTILGKLRWKGVDTHAYSVQQELFERGLNDSNAVAVPRTLGIDPSNRIWFQKFVPGQAMEDLLSTQAFDEFSGSAQRIASALVALHGVTIDHRPLKEYTERQEVESLCSRLRDVAKELPEHRRAIASVIRKANRIATSLTSVTVCGIHRDFHPAQALLTPDRLFLVDFDLYCHGPADLDAGNFLAHLWELAIRFPEQAERWNQAASQFRDSYLEIAEGVTSESLQAWAWIAFARHIWISRRIPARNKITSRLIAAVLAR